tara:strand:+ start:141 stop:809 length:669 start_codon:yes stop_codon:yes gene_type:complete
MTGFVGTRARKRRRNTIFYSIFFVIVILIILYLPLIDFSSNDNPIPDDNIFPDLEKDTSIENTTIEDLQLLLFQKDQKIKFRDGRIISLQSELKKLENIYENLNLQYKNIEKKYNNYIKQQNSKKTIEVDPNKINDLQSKISNLQSKNEKNNLLIESLEQKLNKQKVLNKINSEDNEALMIEYQKIISRNIKLDNLIENLESIIESQNIEINKLKDVSHHNQ